jgi:hypothetical protein
VKYDARVAKIAALYRSGSSTEGLPAAQVVTVTQEPERALRWRAELAKSMARLERRRAAIVPAAQAVKQPSLRAIPGLLIVGAH